MSATAVNQTRVQPPKQAPAPAVASRVNRAVIPISRTASLLLVGTAILGVLVFCWPLLISPDAVLLSGPQGNATTAALVMAGLLPLLLTLVVVQLSNSDLDVKALAMLGVLTAVGAVVRPLGAGTAGLETVFFLIILGGRVFGPGFGFLLGNTVLFTSALITGGVGTWLPYQMLASGFVGLFAGVLPRLRGLAEIALLCVYGALTAFIYGMAMDFSYWPFAIQQGSAAFDPAVGPLENLHRFLVVNLVTGMGWNTGRAITNTVLLVVLGPPVLTVLRRAARRASFG